MKKLLLAFFIISLTANCQDFGKLDIITRLPNSMDEVSGIEQKAGSPLLWMIDDSGNSAKVFGYDVSVEKISKTISLKSLRNHDWEDLASDVTGNLYIGDFGNNENKRKNLAIYKVAGIDSDSSAITTTRFHFEDQHKFPPKKKNRNFDVEAFIFLKDNFYLFTRNRSSKFDGTTKLYKVPAREGNFAAKLIGSYVTCKDRDDCQITSATINLTTGMIALLSYNKVWLLSEYTGDAFFDGSIEMIKLKHRSQKESITFKNEKTLYIADERNKKVGGNLYELRLK